ncbi:RICIN domain-containing protein [Streptomyces sp. ISL-1]|uniref:RICIN domain-containing protein n=1 Tax=Streptomyces sp. ISL-1 TaxID=2817657 RepID=UPI0020364E3D|nr:RICIN domain-containing protein [Streptomyces sp. ISL-1]
MQNPRTSGPVPPPRTGLSSGDSDEGLAAALRAGGATGEARAVAVVLARHWQPVFDYASICAPSARAASMLATAASHKVLENLRQARTTAALRPLLLMTARQIGKAWAADERITALPELQNPDTGHAVPVDMFTIPENRGLIARAFQAMPDAAQCLLWHVEVEGEGISVPAGLLAVDPRGAAAQLEQAREILREGCLRAHLELAPDMECRHYNRLLDISLRRGGPLIPDIQAHLAECQHCRYGAEQLNQADGRLALLLAEGVLGPAARPYLDSRPARSNARPRTARTVPVPSAVRGAGRHSRGGRPRSLPRVTFQGRPLSLSHRGRGAVVTGLGVVTGLLVVAAVVTELWPEDDSHAGPAIPSGSVSAVPAPGSQLPSSPAPQPSTTSAALPTGPLSTRLRNVDSALCLDILDRMAQLGAEATMAPCSSSVTQQWVYENDGLLRSAAAPELCLNSHELDGVMVLALCADPAAANAADVRYDLTIQGDVIPRWNDGLAVVPTAAQTGATVVVKVRDGSLAQRWATDNVAVGSPRTRQSADSGNPPAEEVNTSPSDGKPAPPVGTGAVPDPHSTARHGEDPRSDVRRAGEDGSGSGPDARPPGPSPAAPGPRDAGGQDLHGPASSPPRETGHADGDDKRVKSSAASRPGSSADR